MSGAEDPRDKLGAERIIGLAAAAVGSVTQAINTVQKFSKLAETKRMNSQTKQAAEAASEGENV